MQPGHISMRCRMLQNITVRDLQRNPGNHGNENGGAHLVFVVTSLAMVAFPLEFMIVDSGSHRSHVASKDLLSNYRETNLTVKVADGRAVTSRWRRQVGMASPSAAHSRIQLQSAVSAAS